MAINCEPLLPAQDLARALLAPVLDRKLDQALSANGGKLLVIVHLVEKSQSSVQLLICVGELGEHLEFDRENFHVKERYHEVPSG